MTKDDNIYIMFFMESKNPQSLSAEIINNNFLFYDLNSRELSDLKIYGITHKKDADNLPCDMPGSCYTLFVLLGGNINIYANGKPFLLSKNQVLIKFPDSSLKCSGAGESAEYIRVDFGGTNAAKLCRRCMLSPSFPIYKNTDDEIVQAAKALQNTDSFVLSKDIANISALYRLFSAMIENLCSELNCSDKEHYIISILGYIKDNYQKPGLTLKEVANHVNLHFNYISQLFKKVTGISFSRYINIYRIQKACEIIENGEFFIKDVAHRVGFEDPLHFSKVFKNIKGVSPKNYEKDR